MAIDLEKLKRLQQRADDILENQLGINEYAAAANNLRWEAREALPALLAIVEAADRAIQAAEEALDGVEPEDVDPAKAESFYGFAAQYRHARHGEGHHG